MFQWVTQAVNSAATSAAQLTQAAVDSIVGDEDEPQSPEELSAAARMLFDVDVGAGAASRRRPPLTSAVANDVSNRPRDPHVGESGQERRRSHSRGLDEGDRPDVGLDKDDDGGKEARGRVRQQELQQQHARRGRRCITTKAHVKALPPPPPLAAEPLSRSGDGSEAGGKVGPDLPRSWAPRGLAAAADHSQHLLSFGRDLLDRGAGAALRVLPDLDASNSVASAEPAPRVDRADLPVQRPASEPAPARDDTLQALRSARGAAELSRRAVGAAEEVYIADIIDPASVAEYEAPDAALANDAPFAWVRGTSIGEEMSRVAAVAIGPAVQGARVCEAEAQRIHALVALPAAAQAAADCVTDVLLNELRSIFTEGHGAVPAWSTSAAPRYEVDVPRALAAQESASRGAAAVDAAQVAANTSLAHIVMDLVHFALFITSQSTVELCAAAQECVAAAAREAGGAQPARLKHIKERSLAVRGECFVASAAAVAAIEEALECVNTLFPTSATSVREGGGCTPQTAQPTPSPAVAALSDLPRGATLVIAEDDEWGEWRNGDEKDFAFAPEPASSATANDGSRKSKKRD